MAELCLQIGGLLLRLRCSEEALIQGLANLYGSFVTHARGQVDLDVEVHQAIWDARSASTTGMNALRSAVERGLQNDVGSRSSRIQAGQIQVEQGRRLLSYPGFVDTLQAYHPGEGHWRTMSQSPSGAWFVDEEARQAKLYLISDGRADFTQQLGGYLSVLVSLSLARLGGLVLHAAGVVDMGRGYLFAGPSGSGKTTIAQAARDRGWSVLADDGLIVRRMGDGQFRVFRTPWNAMGPPWQGSFGPAPESAPVCGVFFVRHAEVDRWERLGPVEESVRMVEAAFPTLKLFGDRDAETALALLAALSREVPCYDLHFSIRCGFLQQIKSIDRGGW